jgi:hypothetical protein
VSESELQKETLNLARLLGWKIARFPMLNLTHDGKPRKLAYDTKGFPDSILVRNGTILFAEFKAAYGKLSAEQGEWQAELDAAVQECVDCDYSANEFPTDPPEHGVKNYVWRPADWLSGTIEKALR